jgi:hypothetical protein
VPTASAANPVRPTLPQAPAVHPAQPVSTTNPAAIPTPVSPAGRNNANGEDGPDIPEFLRNSMRRTF